MESDSYRLKYDDGQNGDWKKVDQIMDGRSEQQIDGMIVKMADCIRLTKQMC